MKLRRDDEHVSEQTTPILTELQEMLHPASQRTKYGKGFGPQQEKNTLHEGDVFVSILNFKSKFHIFFFNEQC